MINKKYEEKLPQFDITGMEKWKMENEELRMKNGEWKWSPREQKLKIQTSSGG